MTLRRPTHAPHQDFTMTRNSTITILGASMLAAASMLGLACAHDPSKELVAARVSYQEAAEGPAGTEAKAEVYEAEKALARAEQAHDKRSGSAEEVDLAYVALRKSANAIAHATYLQFQAKTQSANADYVSTLEGQKASAESRLETSEGALASKSKDLAAAEAARDSLQRQLTAAMASLSDMAKVSQEGERTIITLSGAVLFRSDETQLLPLAQDKLAEVAGVLKQYGDEYSISVNGHTDSRGSDSHNQQLSQGRADSVRSFLVSKGVSQNSITSMGQGEAQPIAVNTTAEGRANNRRVEIIVDRKPAT